MNVLVVDDDHLVRKGIISMMPWHDFGLRVTGEAENGRRALQFMESHPVDLLITDIAMPTMTGLELTREVRQRYPEMPIVVLTFHQDFEYVQEALRLGAIDYIAKVELEHENMSDVLARITGRIREHASRRAASAPHADSPEAADRDRALFVVSGERERASLPEPLLPPERARQLIELGKDVWLLPDLTAAEAERAKQSFLAACPDRWTMGEVRGVSEQNRKYLYKLVALYIDNDFFYGADLGKRVCEVAFEQLQAERPPLAERDLYRIKEGWSSLSFVYDERRFRQLADELAGLRPSVGQLESLFFWTLLQWEGYASIKLTELLDGAHFRYWSDWLAWIERVRSHIRAAFNDSHYSEEVVASVMKAVDYINQNLSIDLKLTEVAVEVHISRSYFSECFKNIVGKTFNEYVRDARIEHSKALLGQTNEPIYKIAERCGYPDERYFSKVFRRKVGVLPSEARRRAHGARPLQRR